MRTPTAPPKARFLRYHFESRAQAEGHFHRIETRTLLFFPAALSFHYGETVNLELSIGGSAQTGLLRGRVRFLEHGMDAGGWLEFSARKVAAAIHSASTSARRGERRLASDLCVSVRRRGSAVLCRVEDLSNAGLRLSGAGRAFTPDEEVFVTMPGRLGEVGTGLVCWTRSGEMGLRLLVSPGSSFPKVVAEAEADLERVIEVRHLPACRCGAGERREPSIPRAFKTSFRSRDAISPDDRVAG